MGRGRHLCTAGRVLCGAAGYELCVVVLKEVLVEAHVLVFGEDGVVGIETVFGEHGFIATYIVSIPSER